MFYFCLNNHEAFFMGTNINIPQILALRKEVERNFGKITSHSGFKNLSEQIEQRCREHISITTLERIWNYSTRNADNISVRILDIISRSVGADNWENFCDTLYIKAQKESELFRSDDAINCSELTEGTRIRIGWMPDRECEMEYVGGRNSKFKHQAGRLLLLHADTERQRALYGLFHT